MLDFGTTRVELGVQVLDDGIYSLVQRGHTVADVVCATALLKRYGFKVYYHWMPGLPGSTPAHDLEMTRLLFDSSGFRPDGLKLYPTMVNTQGGPKRNSKCEVVDPFSKPIPRLYTAGELGSFWGWMYNGGGNNAEALCTGRIAARNICSLK